MTGTTHPQHSLIGRLLAATGLKTLPMQGDTSPAARQEAGSIPLPLEAEIQRRVHALERDAWVPVAGTCCALQPARFSPGVPPAWSLLIPGSADFRVGDRLVIGARVFQPVVISPLREVGLRELVALEEWSP